MTDMLRRLASIACVAAALSSPASAQVGVGTGLSATVTPPVVSLSGATFFRDGLLWRAKGLVIDAFDAPDAALPAPNVTARSYWGGNELAQAKAVFSADTLRFLASQPGIDPQSAIYDPRYLTELQAAVMLARAAGFIIILAMNANGSSGLKDAVLMPNDATARAWQVLAPLFAADKGVMYEPYNEPSVKTQDIGSQDTWLAAMNGTIAAIRGAGAPNILLLDGMSSAHSLVGLGSLAVSDPLSNWAFAVHPYFEVTYTNSTNWENKFGGQAGGHAILVTEWNAEPKRSCVDASLPTEAANLLAYLNTKSLGAVLWSLDFPGKGVKDNISYTPTDYSTFTACNDGSNSGAGTLFQAWVP